MCPPMSLPAFSPMGDSDDEFDRRRRDKFRRERSDMERSREREDRRRDDWQDRWAHLNTHLLTHSCVLRLLGIQQNVCVCVCREWDRGRERRRDYDRGRRERFSPSRHISPQHKRLRRDWWVVPHRRASRRTSC